MDSDLNSPPIFYEIFHVGAGSDSELSDVLFTTDLSMDPNEDPQIMSPKDGTRTSFIGVVRYFFVKYYMVFGSFDRLKLCKSCEKLFLEKKLGHREFCSGLCRKKYHDALQSPEKRLCRERQNSWIRYQFNFHKVLKTKHKLMRFTVQKFECETCKKCLESGDCQVLRDKNDEAFKIIDSV